MATLSTLVSFSGSDGAEPAGLIADANGDLFGTTSDGGANSDGTVFEIAKTAAGYASTPTTLVSFNGTERANPSAGLIADATGDLFGTTNRRRRGRRRHGVRDRQDRRPATPARPPRWSASTAPTAIPRRRPDRRRQRRPVRHDRQAAARTARHGVRDRQDRSTGYASTPTTLVSFNGANGAYPVPA